MRPDSQPPPIEMAASPKMNITCPHCQSRLSVMPSQAGNAIHCPSCNGKFQVPIPMASPSSANSFGGFSSQSEVQAFASKKVTAGLCGILLGGLGVHKFVLGLNGPATIMLATTLGCLTVGACLIVPLFLVPVLHTIGFIEGIIYLTKSDEEFYQTYAIEQKEWF